MLVVAVVAKRGTGEVLVLGPLLTFLWTLTAWKGLPLTRASSVPQEAVVVAVVRRRHFIPLSMLSETVMEVVVVAMVTVAVTVVAVEINRRLPHS